jgi:hypothetical protein
MSPVEHYPCIPEIPGSYLGQGPIILLKSFRGFPQLLLAKTVTVSQNEPDSNAAK